MDFSDRDRWKVSLSIGPGGGPPKCSDWPLEMRGAIVAAQAHTGILKVATPADVINYKTGGTAGVLFRH
jgi:hypothetical protein